MRSPLRSPRKARSSIGLSEFGKEKIGFAIALLATIFTLTPVVEEYELLGFSIAGLTITVWQLYVTLAVTLGLAVYVYAVQLVTEKAPRFIGTIGDAFYATAIVLPALLVALFLVDLLSGLLGILLEKDRMRAVSGVLSALAAATAVASAYYARRTLTRLQRKSDLDLRSEQELDYLRRADQLLQDGHFDLAVVEAFRALEASSSELSGKHHRDWFAQVSAALPSELSQALQRTRRLRNSAAHGSEVVLRTEAEEAIRVVGRTLAVLQEVLGRCPDCGSGVVVEYGSDHGHSWSKRRCTKCRWEDLS